MYVVVYGDDFGGIGTSKALETLDTWLKEVFEILRAQYVGPPRHGGETATGQFLKRTISSQKEGFTWRADPRHAAASIEQSGRKAATRTMSPGSKAIGRGCALAQDAASEEATAVYRSSAPTALYIAADRPDISPPPTPESEFSMEFDFWQLSLSKTDEHHV